MTRTLRIRRGSVAFLSTLAWAMLTGGASALAASPQSTGAAPAAATTQSCPAMLNLTFPRLQDDSPQDLCQFAGRVVLVVNTASYCGFTKQYAGLEQLFERYRSRGFVVLGFPSNDFGQQEPGSNRQIAEFCANTFDVKFPMFAKSAVTGSGANPLFAALARQAGGPPRWNFHKYLIGRDGRVIEAYPSTVEPLDRRIVREIERNL